MALIGLDIGTTGCKACLFDLAGRLLARASREVGVDFPQPGWAEQDIEQVWRLALEALAEVIHTGGVKEVAAIGLSVHGEAVTPLDGAGRPLRPMILGMDTRSGPQNEWLAQHLGAQRLFEQTGMPIHTINTLPKLLWLRQNEPEIWRQARRFVLVEDFFIQRLTGQPAISHCLASRTQLYDLGRQRWSAEILQALELDSGRLSPVLPSGSAVGPVRAELSAELGFSRPPLVVTGGHDQACGALGAGLTRPGLAMVSTGTAEVVEVALASPALNTTLMDANISVYAHVVPGLYLAMTLNHSGGLLLRWFRDTLCEGERQRAAQSGEDAYDLILREAPAGPSGLLVLPHFAGSGTPWLDTQSKGAVLGLTFQTRRADLAKAILEGLTFELRVNLDLLQRGGVAIEALRAIGGGARSDLWLQLKADVTGIPVVAPEIHEAAGLGAALLAGVGAGLYRDPAQAGEACFQARRAFTPRPEQAALYAGLFEQYNRVYPAIREINHAL